jgi:hypothetical protein
MVDTIKIIKDAYDIYKENWRSVITAFVVIFLIGLVFGVINFFASLPEQFICNGKENILIVLIFCISPQILQYILGLINGLISLVITMAVIKPLDEITSGKTISSWASNFSKQLVNAVLVILLRTILLIVSFGPVVAILVLNISILIALRNSSNVGVLFGGGLVVFFIVLAVCLLVFTILSFLLMFLEIEIVLGGSGIMEAGVKSAKLVTSNLGVVVVYALIWFLINIVVGLLTVLLICTICLLPLAYLIHPLLVTPIELLSKIILWRRLKGSG